MLHGGFIAAGTLSTVVHLRVYISAVAYSVASQRIRAWISLTLGGKSDQQI